VLACATHMLCTTTQSSIFLVYIRVIECDVATIRCDSTALSVCVSFIHFLGGVEKQ